MAKTYFEKLQDPRWQKKRLEIFERDKFKCVGCKNEDNTLHVHHKYYDSRLEPWEYELETLVTLCQKCHTEMEGVRRNLNNMIGYLTLGELIELEMFLLNEKYNVFERMYGKQD